MKNIKRYKLPGFTLLETIIAMVIAAITITIFYWIFTFIRHQYATFTQEQEKIMSLLLFKKAILQDIDKCDYIYTPDGSAMYWFIYPDDTVVYELYPAVYIYKAGATDSTGIITRYIRAEYLDLLSGSKVVKSIHLSTLLPVDVKNISFNKYYSSEQLMNVPM